MKSIHFACCAGGLVLATLSGCERAPSAVPTTFAGEHNVAPKSASASQEKTPAATSVAISVAPASSKNAEAPVEPTETTATPASALPGVTKTPIDVTTKIPTRRARVPTEGELRWLLGRQPDYQKPAPASSCAVAQQQP